MTQNSRAFLSPYAGAHLDRIAFPLGGLGSGMVCLDGGGALTQASVRNRPELFHEPLMFAGLYVKSARGEAARVIEGPVPSWKLLFPWSNSDGSGRGHGGKSWGLPRFQTTEFAARFPFATVDLVDQRLPLTVSLTGWSPFIPGNADDSSLPVAALEYTLTNSSTEQVAGVFSYHAQNFLWLDQYVPMSPKDDKPIAAVDRTDGGFVLQFKEHATKPWLTGAFSVATDAPDAAVNCRWFRGGWFDGITSAWHDVELGRMPDADPYTEGGPGTGGSLFVPFDLAPGETKTILVRLSWHVPHSDQRTGVGRDDSVGEPPADQQTYRPWYAGRFGTIDEVNEYWKRNFTRLRSESAAFMECFFDTTLPAEVVEAVSANLSILKSPTVLRQIDGRLWLWEGTDDAGGSCPGSCTHVWNYAQAINHLFPDLERSLRETEFRENEDERGHQTFRACLPIRPNTNGWHSAADGQLGGIMKVYREWCTSGDTAWLRPLWPAVKRSLDFCIATWDPSRKGLLEEPHHNTYDIEFWGPDGMCGSFYVAALRTACLIGAALGESTPQYADLYQKARQAMESELFDGEYFIQNIRWLDLQTPPPKGDEWAWNISYSPEALQLLRKEGPKYQYGRGCLSDGVLGAWIAEMCGVGEVLDPAKVRSHLLAVHRYNFRHDLSEHANPQRAAFANGHEAGLLLCSWPKEGKPSLPFIYSDEVWTGIEYQVASHLILMGCVDEGLEIVRGARSRYDGRIRNPFSEIECGYWYGRALASYGLLQAMTGQRYDAVTQTLYLQPRITGDWKAFLCTATGFGSVGMINGKLYVAVVNGAIPIDRIEIKPA